MTILGTWDRDTGYYCSGPQVQQVETHWWVAVPNIVADSKNASKTGPKPSSGTQTDRPLGI